MKSIALTLLLLSLGLLPAQDSTPQPSPPASQIAPELLQAVRALVARIQDYDQQITAVRQEINTTPSAELRSQRVSELRDLQQRRSVARLDLLDILSDADLRGFQPKEETSFSLQNSIEDLLRPLIEEVRRATADSRERRALQNRYDETKQRTEILQSAVKSLDLSLQSITDPTVRPTLESVRTEFANRYEDANDELTILNFRLDEAQQEQHSLIDETSGIFVNFFRARGINLLSAILAAIVVAIGFRFLHRYLHDNTAVFKRGRSQAARLLDVVLYFLTFLGSLIAVVMVLLIAGDWVLLGLVVLIVLALLFAAKDTLPGYMDDFRLMLNLGAVREGERIIYDGVPWLVENLTFFTTLHNPTLRGGHVRIPIARLHNMISRPTSETEPYFPSEEGDWVELGDEFLFYGKVTFQSVEMVRLQLLGGAEKTYSTAAYLEQNPQNRSHGFRISTTIGIDYSHQPDATGKIRSNLESFLREAVEKEVDPAEIRAFKVEFAYANTSSLDYTVQLDLKGSLAARYYPITRALHRIAVDACNQFGLGIPFQQITLHQAGKN